MSLVLTVICAFASTGFPWLLVAFAAVVNVKMVLVSAIAAVQNNTPTLIAPASLPKSLRDCIIFRSTLYLAHWSPKCKPFIHMALERSLVRLPYQKLARKERN